MKKTIFAICIACFLSNSVQAAIIDDAGYFKDDETGYTWMDLTNYDIYTYNYNQVESEIQGTGFHVATLPQLEQLWTSTYQYTFEYLYSVMGGLPGYDLIAGIFNNELDNNTAGLAFSWDNYYGVDWILESDSTPYDDPTYNIKKDRSYIFGFWLVDTTSYSNEIIINTAPEPSTLLLISTGLLGLTALGRTRRS
jgi:hypothetical protein